MKKVDTNEKYFLNPYWNINVSLIIIFSAIFGLISIIAFFGVTDQLNKSITDLFSSIRNQSFDLVMIIITTTSDTINLIIVGFILTIIKRTRKIGMVLLIAIISITILVTYVKPLFGIAGPENVFIPLVDLPEKFTLEKDSFMPFSQNYSYPSNHLASVTAFGFIVAGLSYNKVPRFSKSFLILFPAIIGFTKLYLFQHNLIDILGGFFFGLIIVTIIIKVLKIDSRQTNPNSEIKS